MIIGARIRVGWRREKVVSKCSLPLIWGQYTFTGTTLTDLGQREDQANRTTNDLVDKLAKGITKSEAIPV
jgi:hypothetical protein